MRFELLALPLMAVLIDAAAISSKPKSSSCTTCPATIQDTDAAIASVMSQMSAQSPKSTQAHATTVSVTGSAVSSTAVAKMTTAKVSPAPTSSSKAHTSSTKKSSSSGKKHQRRATSTSTSASSSSSSIASNSACATVPNYGYTYVPQPTTTPSAFLKDSTLHAQSMSAVDPDGYVWTYAGLYASNNQAGYMYNTELSSYNTTQCASLCNSQSACKGFNIYFERVPTLVPGNACPNPNPQTSVRCAFYSQALNMQYATNVGQWRNSFAVLITGANAYNKAT